MRKNDAVFYASLHVIVKSDQFLHIINVLLFIACLTSWFHGAFCVKVFESLKLVVHQWNPRLISHLRT